MDWGLVLVALAAFFGAFVAVRIGRGRRADESRPAPEAARRAAATVLFADIRGFTHLSQRREADVVFRLLGEYSRRMTEALHREGGVVQRILGDGLVAAFGLSQETGHAEAAVRGALAMQAEASALEGWWEEHAGSPLRIVVALNSGEVLCGQIGGELHSESTILGDAVNVAARLEAVAKELDAPIILTGETARLIEGTFPFRSLGRRHLRGRTGEVDLFALGTGRPGGGGDPFATRGVSGQG